MTAQPFGTTWAAVPHVQVGDDARYVITTRPQSYDVPAGVTINTRTGAGSPVACTVYTLPALFALVRDASLALERIEAVSEQRRKEQVNRDLYQSMVRESRRLGRLNGTPVWL